MVTFYLPLKYYFRFISLVRNTYLFMALCGVFISKYLLVIHGNKKKIQFYNISSFLCFMFLKKIYCKVYNPISDLFCHPDGMNPASTNTKRCNSKLMAKVWSIRYLQRDKSQGVRGHLPYH